MLKKHISKYACAIGIMTILSGCSESNGVDYVSPSPQSGFATNKQVFAAQYSAADNQWNAPKSTLFTLPITFKNVSASAWSSHTAEQPVRASYHWLDLEKNMLIFEGARTSFPSDVTPGAKQTIDLQVKPPEQKGQYILQVTMVQEGVAWFEQQYVTPLELKINID